MGDDLGDWKAAIKAGAQLPERALLHKQYLPDKIKAEGGKYTFTISTGAVDRDRDTIAVAGWNLDNYRKNPTVLWAHDYSGLPVARAESILAQNGQLIARTEFVPGSISPFAETVRQLVEAGFLRATSVGFRPLKWVYNEERGGYDFTEAELLEFSIVPVPSNPEALVQAHVGGVKVAPLKEWAIKILDSYGLTDEEKEQAAKVLKLATPAMVTVAGAPPEPIDAPHAVEKSGEQPEPAIPAVVEKRGRVLSAATEERIRKARGHGDELCKVLDEVLSAVAEMDDDEDDDSGKSIAPENDPPQRYIREPRLVVRRPREPGTFAVNPETVKQAVTLAVRSELRRRRGLLD